jgi:hypothetical protein
MLALLRRNWGLVAGGLLIVFLVAALGVMAGKPSAPGRQKTTEPARQHEGGLEQAQEIFGKATDANSFRTALQQLNVYQANDPGRRAAPLSDSERTLLLDRKQLGLTEEELAEVENASFTGLDAHYLELCFLLRDAVRSLEVDGLSQPEQAAAAFAWVVRQVRLVERPEGLIAPEFVLSRGWGTSRERAVIVVGLLEQLGIPACVLSARAEEPDQLQPWSCGALVEPPGGGKKEVLLFDPRLGLPLPGPAGSAAEPARTNAFRTGSPVPVPGNLVPASLAALCRQPDALKALTVDDKHPYDVTAEQLKGTHIYLVGLLSGLAPRMRSLQEELAPVRGGVRVGLDPAAALEAWKAVAAEQGSPAPEVRWWREAVGCQYDFWPPEEGGGDRGKRMAQRRSELVPWSALPQQIIDLQGSDPGDILQSAFGQFFASFTLNSGMPPDLVLRGRSEDAARLLVEMLDQLREQRDRLHGATGLDESLNKWCADVVDAQAAVNRAKRAAARSAGKDRATEADLAEARAQLADVWKGGEETLHVLLDGRAADVQVPDGTYLLALCKQGQAERLQRQADRARRAGRPGAEAQAAPDAWADANYWWGKYDAEPPPPSFGGQAAPRRSSPAAARLLQARAQLALGQRDQAVRQLEDLSGELTGLEQTARLYLARQFRKP